MSRKAGLDRAPASDATLPTPSIRRRLASMLYESMLLLGVLSVAFMVPHLVVGVAWGIAAPGVVLWLHLFLVMGAYFIWLWTRGGQTLAMQTWRVQLVDALRGATITPRQAVLRYVLSWPALAGGGLGIVWALFDPDRQFLHDRLAGTRLVELPRGQKDPH